MAKNPYLAGVGKALIMSGNELIGVAQTLTNSTLNFSITGDDIRGGRGNALIGKYFHDSNLTCTLTDALFNLQYIALSLGVPVNQGGITIKEEELTVGANGTVTTSETPVAFDGSMIGWYKKPSDDDWNIGNISGTSMTISGASKDDVYCVKYFYLNENATSITIKSQYVPSIVHIVIMTDLYPNKAGSQASGTKYGRLLVDIPQFLLDGNQDLTMDATSSATVSLTGSALAVLSGNSCEEDPYYGTMTEEIFDAKWQDNVVAIVAENSDMDLATSSSETIILRAVYGKGMPSQRKDNSNFTFIKMTTPASTATGVSVSSSGVVSAGTITGVAMIEVTLKGYANVEPAYVKVTVT